MLDFYFAELRRTQKERDELRDEVEEFSKSLRNSHELIGFQFIIIFVLVLRLLGVI